MKKEWFVFRNDHHEGPYSREDICRDYRQGKIREKSLVWKEGQEHWSPLRDEPSFRKLFPEEKKTGPTPPPLPLPLPSSTPEPSVEKRRQKRPLRLGLILIVMLFFLLLFLGTYVYFTRSQVLLDDNSVKLPQMLSKQKERIEEVLASHSHSHLLGLSEDGSGLWLAYGRPIIGQASIYLKSKKDRILSSEEHVEVFASEKMARGFIIFNDFETLRGKALAPGEYNYRIRLHPEGPLAHMGRFLRDKGLLKKNTWAFIFGDIISLTGTFPYYGDDREHFERALKALNKKKHFQKNGAPLVDQLEKLKVFFSMMKQTKDFFEKNINEAKVGSDFVPFKNHYMEKISPLLQQITLDSHERSVNLMDSQMDVASEHREIFENGKEVISFISEVIEKTTNVENYTPTIKEKISQEFTEHYNTVLEQLNVSLEKRKKKSEDFLEQ